MSKKEKAEKAEKPAKAAKGGSLEEATASYETAKKERQAARAELEKFEKANGLQPKKKHGDHETHGKAWKKLNNVWKAAKEAETAAEDAMKALKPKKERLSGKYTYPEDVVTSEDKKKYRAAQRAANKKLEKGETAKADKPAKKDKEKASKEEAAPVAKSDKKKKGSKEEAPAAPVEETKKKKKKVTED